jgi:hypothetical protein
MKRTNPNKMSRVELGRLGAEAEDVTFDNTRPLTPEARRALNRAASKGGHPRVGAGARRINVTVEKTLLDRADAYARRHGLTRRSFTADGKRSRPHLFRIVLSHSRKACRVARAVVRYVPRAR